MLKNSKEISLENPFMVTCYDIRESDIHDGKGRRLPNVIEFLVYKNNQWEWVNAELYEPYI